MFFIFNNGYFEGNKKYTLNHKPNKGPAQKNNVSQHIAALYNRIYMQFNVSHLGYFIIFCNP